MVEAHHPLTFLVVQWSDIQYNLLEWEFYANKNCSSNAWSTLYIENVFRCIDCVVV